MGSLRDELLEMLGPEGLRRLSEARGGRRAYIPRRPRDLHWLVLAVGREAADKLAWRCGGDRIEIPKPPMPGGEGRDERIRRLRALGWSAAAIAEDAGISRRQVYRILAG